MAVFPKSSSTDAALYSGKGQVAGFSLAGGSDAAKAIFYDNASAASGTVLGTLAAAANGFASITFPEGVTMKNGCYVDVTGTAPTATVYIR